MHYFMRDFLLHVNNIQRYILIHNFLVLARVQVCISEGPFIYRQGLHNRYLKMCEQLIFNYYSLNER